MQLLRESGLLEEVMREKHGELVFKVRVLLHLATEGSGGCGVLPLLAEECGEDVRGSGW